MFGLKNHLPAHICLLICFLLNNFLIEGLDFVIISFSYFYDSVCYFLVILFIPVLFAEVLGFCIFGVLDLLEVF